MGEWIHIFSKFSLSKFGKCSVLSDPAVKRIADCAALKGVIVTNTIPQQKSKLALAGDKIVTLDISTLLAEAVRRTHNGESISALFGPSFASETTIV